MKKPALGPVFLRLLISLYRCTPVVDAVRFAAFMGKREPVS